MSEISSSAMRPLTTLSTDLTHSASGTVAPAAPTLDPHLQAAALSVARTMADAASAADAKLDQTRVGGASLTNPSNISTSSQGLALTDAELSATLAHLNSALSTTHAGNQSKIGRAHV